MSTLNVNNINEAGGVDPVITGGVLDSGSLPAGSILQVVQTVKLDSFSTTSTSYVDVTDLSVSITPRSASNKVLVILDMRTGSAQGTTGTGYQLLRDASVIYFTTVANTHQGVGFSATPDNAVIMSDMAVFLDSPATTSAVTYKPQVKTGTSGQAIFVNESKNSITAGGVSSITVLEVAG